MTLHQDPRVSWLFATRAKSASTCAGPTVYGPAHLGHGRATLSYDILRRYLEWTGLEVRLVSNITDIDDQIIKRANNENRPWKDITTKCEAMWFEAMDGINVKRPTDIPRATEYVEGMVAMIGELVGPGQGVCDRGRGVHGRRVGGRLRRARVPDAR